MKQLTLIALALTFTLSAFSQQPPAAKTEWTTADRKEFINSCIGTAVANMSRDSARYYCQCMQEKVELKYPSMEEVNKLSDSTFMSPEWQKEVKGCFGGWSSIDRTQFISECARTAKEKLGEDKAMSYCECMAYKVEKKYPRSADAVANLSAAEFAKPEWKKIIDDCLK